ncbi:group II intron reverse transcriptase/maturase, partial [Butyricicoccus sp. 1XD8-22]
MNSLEEKDAKYEFHRLYRNLYNVEFYLIAYNNIYAKEGNMTKGNDDLTIDGMSIERINNIIERIKDLSYTPNPARRVYIPKKNGKKRPLGIPSIDDKLVQEVLRMILESIYDKNFSDKSHGFRPNRSCHTALEQFQKLATGAKWWIEGDIEGFFDNIDHQTLIGILRRRIKDERFIQLIQKFLKAGYMEEWTFHKTISGTPQGGIISPILANIYLNELDEFVEELKK